MEVRITHLAKATLWLTLCKFNSSLVAIGTNLPIAGKIVAANNKEVPPPEQAAGHNEFLFLSFVSEQFPLPAQHKKAFSQCTSAIFFQMYNLGHQMNTRANKPLRTFLL
jgi:hypothetical protein